MKLPPELARANPILANAFDRERRFSSFVPDEFKGGLLATKTLLAARSAPVGLINVYREPARPAATRRGRWLLLAAAGAGVIDVVANICYVAATRTGMFGLAVVLASLYPGITVLLARVVLGERLRWVQRAGLGLAAIGILLVAA